MSLISLQNVGENDIVYLLDPADNICAVMDRLNWSSPSILFLLLLLLLLLLLHHGRRVSHGQAGAWQLNVS